MAWKVYMKELVHEGSGLRGILLPLSQVSFLALDGRGVAQARTVPLRFGRVQLHFLCKEQVWGLGTMDGQEDVHFVDVVEPTR